MSLRENKFNLETERLRLQEFNLSDTAFIIRLLNSPGWLEFIGDRNVKNEEQAQAYLVNGPMKSYAEHGFGLCRVELKDNSLPIGMCGFIQRKDLEHPDIGFAFLPEYSGKGYGFEIAASLMNYGRETLRLPEILAITVPNNKPSIRLLEKLGMESRGKFRFPASEEELLLFSTAIQ